MIWAAPVSIASVIALLSVAPPIWSLGGIIIGELLAAVLILRSSWQVSSSFVATAPMTSD